jgi:hypothetical protein
MADTNSTIYIQESVEIRTRQSTGNVGQSDVSPWLKPAAKIITDEGLVAPTRHGESIILLASTAGDPVDVIPDGQSVQLCYVVIMTDKPVNVTFTQAGVTRSVAVRGTFILDCSYTGYNITSTTLHVKALLDEATQVRVYWAGKFVALT